VSNKIKEAKELLFENGYIVIKMTDQMKKDSDDCEVNGFEGDCSSCSCSICIMEG
jgi:hypothetical protein